MVLGTRSHIHVDELRKLHPAGHGQVTVVTPDVCPWGLPSDVVALSSFLYTHSLPPEHQYSHGFLACVITVVLSSVAAVMLTIDWWHGFPSAGLSATLKALIISSFIMTIVIIVGAMVYTWLEGWTFDDSVNFCIVSFSTIGYGNLSPRSVAGRIFFFFYGFLGVSAIGFFIVSLRNAIVEQFQWRLIDQFSRPAHMSRIQTRMSVKDLSYPMACLQEEERVKVMVKRKMIVRMIALWIVFWFGGAGVFCAFEEWTYLESLYFCYVTLTTIGFGDYVPTEPGSIEFWNIYVFIGLTIFAYILSLFSESMSSHFNLVDDVAEEDEDLHRHECEGDSHAPVITHGGILGLDGLDWSRQDKQRRVNLHLSSGDGESGANLSPLSQVLDEAGADGTTTRGAGRVLEIPVKVCKQMSQAESYAANSGSSVSLGDKDNSDNGSYSPTSTGQMSTYGRYNDNLVNSSGMESNDTIAVKMTDSPTTTRLSDLYGVPHRQISGRRTGLPSPGGSSIASASSRHWNNSMHFASQGLIYGSAGYHHIMARRYRYGGAMTASQMAFPPCLFINTQAPRQEVYRLGHCNDSRRCSVYSGDHHQSCHASPLEDTAHQPQIPYLQKSALHHQPQVKFESPVASPQSAGPRRSPLSPISQWLLFGDHPTSGISPSSSGLFSPSQWAIGQGREPRGILKTSHSEHIIPSADLLTRSIPGHRQQELNHSHSPESCNRSSGEEGNAQARHAGHTLEITPAPLDTQRVQSGDEVNRTRARHVGPPKHHGCLQGDTGTLTKEPANPPVTCIGSPIRTGVCTIDLGTSPTASGSDTIVDRSVDHQQSFTLCDDSHVTLDMDPPNGH
ncbi:MAG: hypothetical protein J3Q66DRAFT_390310 [Benniella sp.]|nr:MAG: hypothetical protein J3Q66DRAFT_390310 [Benniella sp.]